MAGFSDGDRNRSEKHRMCRLPFAASGDIFLFFKKKTDKEAHAQHFLASFPVLGTNEELNIPQGFQHEKYSSHNRRPLRMLRA